MNISEKTAHAVSGRGKRRNSKMKVTAFINFKNGEELIGVRASGVHLGCPIEKTVWIPSANLRFMDPVALERTVIAEYRREAELVEKSYSASSSN